ncbi:MAG: glycoside hydrolase family 28 protein [Eubacteriales bacterium]
MDFHVKHFGAAGDGETKDTQAIQHAIDACSEAGGGRVILSEGTFLTGTLFMKSNVEMHIDITAILLGSTEYTDYAANVYRQMYRNESHMDGCLIFSCNADHIAFTGRGTINGQGEKFPQSLADGSAAPRPMLLRYVNCSDIRLKDLKLENPASWTTAFIGCSDIRADGINIRSRANWNGDGLDFDSCQDVFVSNCRLDCSDDCICLQNSVPGSRCRNVMVTNTLMCSKWAGMRIGLLSCGDIENVTVSNCIFRDIECSGLKIQSAEGGVLQNMVFSNLVMENVQRPLFLTLNYFRERVDFAEEVPRTGKLRNLHFQNIRAAGRPGSPDYLTSCMIIDGLPGYPIENITMSGVYYTAAGGGCQEDALRDIPHHNGRRAESFNYEGALPAYGLYARHVKGLLLTELKIDVMNPDGRQCVYLDDAAEG